MSAKVNHTIIMEAILPPANRKDMLIDVDVKNQTVTIQIPPCIADSQVGEKLVHRIMSDLWSFHTASEVEDRRASALEPTSPN